MKKKKILTQLSFSKNVISSLQGKMILGGNNTSADPTTGTGQVDGPFDNTGAPGGGVVSNAPTQTPGSHCQCL